MVKANQATHIIVKRGTKALLTSDEYEKGLLESLDTIKTKSKSLMEEALKSHIYEVHICKSSSMVHPAPWKAWS
jgi:hypothetical protein